MRLALVVISLVLATVSGIAHADGTRLVVVVAKGSPVTDLSRGDLKRMFLGERGDSSLVPFNASPGTPERSGFDRSVLGMSPDEVGRYWIDRKVRGQSGAPRSLPSNAHIAKVVAKFPGAIGYLPVDQLTPDVQPVRIDGIPFTDHRYTIATE